MTERIIALCRAMGAAGDQEELLLPLVQTVLERLAGQLRPAFMPEDCGPAFPLAAAMVVMDRLSGLTGGWSASGAASFTAGDLTIRRESVGGQAAKGLSQQAGELLAPWLRDDGFVFRGIDG